ncbi:MAG: hypothetical protein RLZZ350_277 [Verrucomicrobiota bacterium]|jgi:PAS domain S-box-containing protein
MADSKQPFLPGKYLLQLCLVAAAYFAVAHLGLAWARGGAVASPFWPAAGIELAATVLLGVRIWPGIFLGAGLFNLSEARPLELALALAGSATLEAVLPALILPRLKFRAELDRLRDCLALALACVVAAAVSASIGVNALVQSHQLAGALGTEAWRGWFISNLIGLWVVGGGLIAWSRIQPRLWIFRHAVEGSALVAVSLFVVFMAFYGEFDANIWRPYWVFPVFIWAAIRFGPPGATALSALVTGLISLAALAGTGPFSDENHSMSDNLLALQTFIGLASVTNLILAAVAAGRQTAEQALREQTHTMTTAQRIARFGSWQLALASHAAPQESPLVWSAECYRIFGYAPGGEPITNDRYFARVHPDDRESIVRAIAKSLRDHSEYSLTHRVILPGGETRFVHTQAKVFDDEFTGQPVRMIGTVHDITDHQRAADQLRESEARYHLLAANSTDIISRHNPLGVFLYASPACLTLLGFQPEDLLGRELAALQHPEDIVTTRQALHNLLDQETTLTHTHRLRRQDGTHLWVETTARSLRDPHTRHVNEIICITRDITERRSLESQLQQAQKMDAIGQLAGGVAHDFNNLLTVISGYAGLILSDLPAHHPTRDSITEIRKAADRATALTRQLLAFSRRAMLDPKVTDLNKLIGESEKMVQRLIGEHIQFTANYAPNLAHVKVDRTQMDQVLLNLVVNARDAMPIAGKLTVETANVTLDEGYTLTQADARPGAHVMLAISDNGCGMDRDTLDRIFEPFFTTKGLGKGTGLGLATVYGIVKQSGGHLTVYSEPNFGTTFKIYLPAVDEPATPDTTHITDHGQITPGRGTILLAEDEEAVRAYAERVLFDAGYRVVTAADGKEALDIAETIIDQVDLLLTDVVMPRMGGRQLAETLREKKPTLKILYMSGYTDDAVLRHGVLAAESAFLQKPFSAAVLTKKVQSVLVNGK